MTIQFNDVLCSQISPKQSLLIVCFISGMALRHTRYFWKWKVGYLIRLKQFSVKSQSLMMMQRKLAAAPKVVAVAASVIVAKVGLFQG
jgi:hypothetical protein